MELNGWTLGKPGSVERLKQNKFIKLFKIGGEYICCHRCIQGLVVLELINKN